MSHYPSAILLDMDGTLFDSETVYKKLWQDTAKGFGIDLTDALYQRFIGARFDHCKHYIQELGGAGFDLNAFLAALDKHEDAISPPPLKPGVMELLNWIQEKAMPSALVTSAGMHKVEHHFSALGGFHFFQAIVCGDDVQQPKPSPAPYQVACQKLGIAPRQALAIEDSNPGARSAISAGCQTLIIPDVLPLAPDVLESAVGVLDSLIYLPEWLEATY